MSGRGRPRNPEVDQAIIEAGWAVLGEGGYAGLTFDAVAQKAGCQRAAIYRRFANKRELAVAMVLSQVQRIEPPAGIIEEPRQALVQHLQKLVRFLQGPAGLAALGLSQARRIDPDLSAALDSLYRGERPFYLSALTAASGWAGEPARCHLLIDGMVGAVLFRVLIRNAAITVTEIEALVDQAIDGARALR
jgi:AcrR family transcriptional regulator